MDQNTVVIRGGGDIASGIACRLFNAGYKVIILEIKYPSVIRRKVAFAQAVYEEQVEVEGIPGKLAKNLEEAFSLCREGCIPVLVDEDLQGLNGYKPVFLVDAILAKKNLGTKATMADVVIGVGPGFTAGEDVDAVVETQRGHDLGRVILRGAALPNTGIPGGIGGYSLERVLKSPQDGKIKVVKDIGTVVASGETIAIVGDAPVKTAIKGVVRGMIQDGFTVHAGMKIADVDPRAEVEHCFTVSDKARAIGGGVLEAMLHLIKQKHSAPPSLSSVCYV